MTLTRGAQRAIFAIFFAALAFFYAASWFSPAIGLFHDDGVYLVTAKAIASGHGYTLASLPNPLLQTKYPPVFPAVLALFALVAQQAQWLKLLPLLCAAGWLILTRRLLLKMGASPGGAMLMIGLTAASPTVIFLSTNLFSESLFALLFTAALLMLLEDQPFAAGALAGLATLTRVAGVPLIIACILTLVIRRRLRSAAVFTAIAVVMVAPWFGWSLAHVRHDPYYGTDNYVAANILSGLAANEKLIVLTRNAVLLLGSPLSLLTGLTSMYTVIGTGLLGAWCLYVRRQLFPDLFVGLYCLMLLCFAWPPERFVAPLLPLILWIGWRAISKVKKREALAAVVVILAMLTLWADVRAFSAARAATADNWKEMSRVFDYIRASTSQNSIVMADLDPVIYLNTGRKAVRGFAPDGFGLYYAATPTGVTPDRLSTAITQSGVSYVVLMPDRQLAESASFHRSVEALEHGGILQPVPIPGVSPGYRLLHVAQAGY